MHAKNAHNWKSFAKNVKSRLDDSKPGRMVYTKGAHAVANREIRYIEDNAVYDRKYEDIEDYFNLGKKGRQKSELDGF